VSPGNPFQSFKHDKKMRLLQSDNADSVRPTC
jgi:hypothetical protein